MKKNVLIILSLFFIQAINSQVIKNKFNEKKEYDFSITKKVPESIVINGQNGISKLESKHSNLNGSFILNNKVDSLVDIVFSKETNLPIYINTTKRNQFLSPNITTMSTGSDKGNPKSQCFNFLAEISTITQIKTPELEFEITKISSDELGKTHIKLLQKYKGIKLYDIEAIVHLNGIGQGEIFNGNYAIIKKEINVIPTISKESALVYTIENIKTKTSYKEFTKDEKQYFGYTEDLVDTVLYRKDFQTDYKLAYHVSISPNILESWEYFIDAHDGSIINYYKSSCTFGGPSTATATDLNGTSRLINTYQNGTSYTLIDASKAMYNATTGSGIIQTLDLNYTFGNNLKVQNINSSNNVWTDPKSISAHYNAGVAYDYFKSYHNRNSLDGNGGNIYSLINAVSDGIVGVPNGTPLDNAFWNGKAMLYGNGNILFKPLAGGLDVSGHEMTHGVVLNTAGLEYNGQSGAINESMADIFGCMIDSTNWTIGETIIKNFSIFPSGSLRSLKNPHNGGNSINDQCWQPLNVSEMYLGASDHGGVHINSGIPNYAFYLFANSSVGRLKAQKIYYRALTTYLTKSSQFIDLRLAVIQSAKDLYTSSEAAQAGLAFDAVGITDGSSQISITTLPVNPGNELLLSYNTDITNTNGLYRSFSSGNNLTPLLNKSVYNKPSVSDNGSIAVFIGTDKKMYSINVDPKLSLNLTTIQNQPIWSNVAISKDGKRIAAVTANADTSIYVYDFTKASWYRYMLYNPTFIEGVKAFGVQYADAFEWDYNGENIIYDCFNSIPSSSGTNIQNWDINKIHVWDNTKNSYSDGMISKYFSLADGENVGNPTIAKTSNNLMAFDYYNSNTNQYGVIGYDIENNKIGTIALNNTIGYPSFNKTDDTLFLTGLNSSSRNIINYVKLNSDKISSNGMQTQIISNSEWPVLYAVGTRAFITPPQPIISSNGPTTFCSGTNVVLTSSATFGNQWYKDGILINGAINQTYTVSIAGSYTVISTINSIPSPTSTQLIVIINPLPQTPIISAGGPKIFCAGGNVSLTSNVTIGNQWYKDGVAISGAINSTYIASNAGIYNDMLVNSYGCKSVSGNITIILDTLPILPLTISQNAVSNVCAGSQQITLTSTSGYYYQWYKSDTIINNATTQTYNPTATGFYKMKLYSKNKACSFVSDSLKVSILNSVTRIFSSDTIKACGANYTPLDAGTGYSSYLWSTGATTPAINATQTGLYKITAYCGASSSNNIFEQFSSSNSSTKYLTIPDATQLHFTNQMSLLFKTRIEGPYANSNTLIDKGSNTGYQITLNGLSSSLNFWYPNIDNTVGLKYTLTPSQVQNSDWFYVGVVKRADSSFFYINGNLVDKAKTINPIPVNNSSITMGASNGGSSGKYSGSMDNISFWNRPLSQSEISNYAECMTGKESGCVAYYNFENNSNYTLAIDNSTYGNNAIQNASINTYPTNQIISCSPTAIKDSVFVSVINPKILQNDTTICSKSTLNLTIAQNINTNYTIGNQGQAGGFIIYDKGSNSNGWRYLEASPNDINGLTWWNGSFISTGATGTAIGSGYQNTNTIISAQGSGNYAASVAKNYTNGGFSDWFLPSTSELALVYQNLKLKGIGSANADFYWSSTEFNLNAAYRQNFQTNVFDGAWKYYNTVAVRPIRFVSLPNSNIKVKWSTGDTTATIQVSPTTNTTYWVSITDGFQKCIDSIRISVTAVDTTIGYIGNTTICNGDSTIFIAGFNASSYQWLQNNIPITGAIYQKLTVKTAGDYRVITGNTSGCSDTSRVIKIVVNQTPTAPTISTLGNTTFCSGKSVILTSSSITSQWLLNSNIINGSVGINDTAQLSGIYTAVNIQNGCSSIPSNAITVTVNPTPSIPIIIASDTTKFCVGGKVILTSSASAENQWFLNGTLINGAKYSRDTVIASGSYTVVSTLNGCTSLVSAPVIVTVNPLPVVTITPSGNTNICEGDSVKLTSSTASIYNWYYNTVLIPNATLQAYYAKANGDYVVNVSDTNGCSNSAKITIVVNKIPIGSIQIPTNNFICDGSSIILKTVGGYSYQWYNATMPIIGAIDSSYTANVGGSFSVKYSTQNGCKSTSTNTVILNLIKKPKADFSFDPRCINIPVVFKNLSDTLNSGKVNWLWNLGLVSTSNITTPTKTYNFSGTYNISLNVNSLSCPNLMDSTKKQLIIEPLIVGVNYPIVNAKKSTPINLVARNVGVNYNWIPGIGLNNAQIPNPIATLNNEQLYKINITLASGCSVIDTQLVRVFIGFDVFVPSGFSPDGDGVNDLLRPILIGIKELHYFKVLNRWGQVVYQTNQINAGWDGTFKSMPQPSETYVWLIEAVDDNGEIIRKSGKTTLIR